MKIFPVVVSSVLALSCLSVSAKTGDFSYDYAEVGYYFLNDASVKGGVKLSTSYDVYDHVNLLGSYSFSLRSNQKAPDKFKTKIYTLGLGYHTSLDEYLDKTDAFISLGLLNTHSSITKAGVNTKINKSGRILSLGMRRMASDKAEFVVRIDKPSVPVSDTVFNVGMQYKYSNTTTLGLEFTTGADDGSEQLTASMRWSL